VLARLSPDRADGNQIVVTHGADVALGEGHECPSPSRRGNKLHLESIRIVHLDDGAKITALETVLG
jgi:hypothetical protein